MKQRQVVQLYKQSYTLQIQAEKMSKMEKNITCFCGNNERDELAAERSGVVYCRHHCFLSSE